jgi:hypothetical protein
VQDLPENHILLFNFKKLKKDNKRMKSSIKELKLLLKNREDVINESKKQIIKNEF